MQIQETNLNFGSLTNRATTDMIVLHHTGENDIDASAEQIHSWHLNQEWAGIGYHFVIRKDGTIERGRPEWAVGSHAYGENSHTLGIHISGDFEQVKPTENQIDSCAALIADLCEKYSISCDRAHIVGHGELMPTACPGKNLQALLDNGALIDKAKSYICRTVKNEKPPEEKLWNDIQEKIWNFFKNKGLNDYAIAGIMGNLYAESGLIPTNLQNNFESTLGMSDDEYTQKVDNGSYGKEEFMYDSAGYGLAQWTYYSRKAALYTFAKSKGTSIGDLDTQLEFLWSELEEHSASLAQLKNVQSVREASVAFLLDFERPADQSEGQRAKRAGYSQEFFDKFGGSAMRYNNLNEIPDWAKDTVKKWQDLKILNGDGANLDLSADMVRLIVMFERRMRVAI
ncbi:MAG: N-acetylmuramoyl-L-alanine amidase [Selenomonadaceae bacterium]|nr:N-acetylmuramoyl-L-alanine amidase [Selenomonadaceae bacterium]